MGEECDRSETDSEISENEELEPFANFFGTGVNESSPETFSAGTTTLTREYSHLKGLLTGKNLLLNDGNHRSPPSHIATRRDGGTPETLSIIAPQSSKLELLADLASRPVTESAIFAIQNLSDSTSVVTSCQAIKLALSQPTLDISSDEAIQVRSSILTCLQEYYTNHDLAHEVFGALNALYESGVSLIVPNDEVRLVLEWFRRPAGTDVYLSSIFELALQYANMGFLDAPEAIDLCLAILTKMPATKGPELQVCLSALEALFVDEAVVKGVGTMLDNILEVGLKSKENDLYNDSSVWRAFITLLSQLLSDDAAVEYFNTKVDTFGEIVSNILAHIVYIRGTPLKGSHCTSIASALAVAVAACGSGPDTDGTIPTMTSVFSIRSGEFTPSMSRRMRMASQRCKTEQALLNSLELVRSAIESDALSQVLVSKGAMQQIATLLTSYSTSSDSAELCCSIVQKLAGHTIQIPGAVLESMSIHSSSQNVLSAGISCLYSMIVNQKEEGWGRIYESCNRVITVLCDALEYLVGNEGTGAACAQALLHLMSFPDGQKSLVEIAPERGVTMISTAATTTEHATIKMSCLGCISAISANCSKERAMSLLRHDVVGCCIGILGKQSTADVSTMCVTVLNNLTGFEDQPDALQQVINKNGLQLLQEIIRGQVGKPLRNAASLLLGKVLTDDVVRKEAISNGVLDLVRFTFASASTEDVVSSNVFGYVLAVLSLQDNEMCDTIANDGGLEFVATASKFHSPVLSLQQRKMCTQQLGVLEAFVVQRVEEVDILKEKVEQLNKERAEGDKRMIELHETVKELHHTSSDKIVLESALGALLDGSLVATYNTLKNHERYAELSGHLHARIVHGTIVASAVAVLISASGILPFPAARPRSLSGTEDTTRKALTLLLNDEPHEAFVRLSSSKVLKPQAALLQTTLTMPSIVASAVTVVAASLTPFMTKTEVLTVTVADLQTTVSSMQTRIEDLQKERNAHIETINNKGGLWEEQGRELQEALTRAREAESRVQVLEEGSGESEYMRGKLQAAMDVIAKQNLELAVLRESEQVKCELEVRLEMLQRTLVGREHAATKRDELLTRREADLTKREHITEDQNDALGRRDAELKKTATLLKEREKKIRKMEKRVRASYSGIPVVTKKPEKAADPRPMEAPEAPEREPYRWKRLEREIKRMTLQVLEQTKTKQLDIALQDTEPVKVLLLGLRACPLSTYSFAPSGDQMTLLKDIKQWWSRVRPTWADQYESYLNAKHVYLITKLENILDTTPVPVPTLTPPHAPREPPERPPSSARRPKSIGHP